MVIKEIAKALADLLGIKIEDYNTGLATQENAWEGIEDSIDGAGKAAKEYKRQLLGFDQVHNINENKDNGGSGSSVSGGIDQRLLDAITGYDNGMSKVRMKATEIRDKWMEILGFHKEIDPLTGEVHFKYEGIKKTLKNLVDNFKNLNTQGKVLVGLGIAVLLSKTITNTKKLTTALGGTGLLSSTKKLFTPMKSLYTSLDNVNFANKSLTEGISSGISTWSKSLTAMDKFKVGLVGSTGLVISLGLTKDAMKKISEEGVNLKNSLELVGGSLGAIASGAYAGSAFGPWGTVIGGAIGAISALTSSLTNYETQAYKTADKSIEISQKISETSNNLLKEYDAISESLQHNLAFTDAHLNLINELESITEADGRVKKGHEERATFITTVLKDAYGIEISMIDGVIQNMDTQIKKIKDVITEKKKEILLQSAEESYKKALENKVLAYTELEKAEKNYNDALAQQQEMEKRNLEIWESLSERDKKTWGSFEAFEKVRNSLKDHKKIIQAVEDSKKALDDATLAYDANTNAIMNYNGLLSADTEKNADLVDYYMNQIENTYYDGEKSISLTYKDMIKDGIEYYDSTLRLAKANGKEITEELEAQANSRLNIVTNELLKHSQTVEDITPDIVEGWATLGEQNEKKFMENMKQLPKEIQQEIVDKMYEKGYSLSSEIQKGIDAKVPKVSVNTKEAENSISKFIENAKKYLAGGLGFALGGGGNGSNGYGGSVGGRANGGIYSHGSWKDIPQYANGGLPSHGSMFIAGEAGAEIVGHINGRTEVLNQSQIASAIYNAVASAMSQFNNGGIAEINIHTEEGIIVDTAINGINQKIIQTGQSPIYETRY